MPEAWQGGLRIQEKASMRSHLNTATVSDRTTSCERHRGLFQRAAHGCHCLLVETTTVSRWSIRHWLDDIAQPHRLGRKWVRQTTAAAGSRREPRSTESSVGVFRLATSASPAERISTAIMPAALPTSGRQGDVHRRYEIAVTRIAVAAPKGRISPSNGSMTAVEFLRREREDWFGFKGVRGGAAGGSRSGYSDDPAAWHTPGHGGIAGAARTLAAACRRQLFLPWPDPDPAGRAPLVLACFSAGRIEPGHAS